MFDLTIKLMVTIIFSINSITKQVFIKYIRFLKKAVKQIFFLNYREMKEYNLPEYIFTKHKKKSVNSIAMHNW